MPSLLRYRYHIDRPFVYFDFIIAVTPQVEGRPWLCHPLPILGWSNLLRYRIDIDTMHGLNRIVPFLFSVFDSFAR